MSPTQFYLATVCLDRNRWGSRKPSLAVSEWLPRILADGFDGIELWEFHYLCAEMGEQDRLAEVAAPVAVYNSYADFGREGAESREQAADAIARLQAGAVKYNIGGKPEEAETYRKNVAEWSAQLPRPCRLLCECHPGTILEQPEAAAEYFAELDPARHAAIAHVSGDPESVEQWFAALGDRIAHIHVQMRDAQSDPSVSGGCEGFAKCFEIVRAYGFTGSVTTEFTRGIGREEDIETVYANACRDMNYCRKVLQ